MPTASSGTASEDRFSSQPRRELRPVGQAIEEARRAHPGIEITGYTDLHGFVDVLYAASAEFGISQDESGPTRARTKRPSSWPSRAVLSAAEGWSRLSRAAGRRGDHDHLEKGMPALTNIGVLGDPRRASAEKGRLYLERLAELPGQVPDPTGLGEMDERFFWLRADYFRQRLLGDYSQDIDIVELNRGVEKTR